MTPGPKHTRTPEERAHSLFSPPSIAATPDMAPWRLRLHSVIFETDTPAGRAFDIVLIWAIVISVAAVMLESVQGVNARHGHALRTVEWVMTVLFTVEYVLRILCVGRKLGYMVSFFGVVDLLSVVPTYLSLFFAGTQALLAVRVLRLLRVFRLFKLVQFVGQAEVLVAALIASRAKITVFLGGVLSLIVIMGSVMYIVEGPASGFTSIPRSVYWAVVTLTTVGYGDIAPQTALGQTLAAAVMVLGYAIIAVPTGIVTVEIAAATSRRDRVDERTCRACALAGHDADAAFCKRCGRPLAPEPS